jgi:hypothetical protein
MPRKRNMAVYNLVVTWTIPSRTPRASALQCISRFVNPLQKTTDVFRPHPVAIFFSQQRHTQPDATQLDSNDDSQQARPFCDSNPTPSTCDRVLTAKDDAPLNPPLPSQLLIALPAVSLPCDSLTSRNRFERLDDQERVDAAESPSHSQTKRPDAKEIAEKHKLGRLSAISTPLKPRARAQLGNQNDSEGRFRGRFPLALGNGSVADDGTSSLRAICWTISRDKLGSWKNRGKSEPNRAECVA